MEKLLRTYKNGDLICQQGDPAESLYVLRRGKVGVVVNTEEAKPSFKQILTGGKMVSEIVSVGAIVGEAGLFLKRRTASLKSLADVTALEEVPFGPQGAEALILRNAETGLTLCRSLASRLRDLSEQIRAASSTTISIQATYNALSIKFLALVNRLTSLAEAEPFAELVQQVTSHKLYLYGADYQRRQHETQAAFKAELERKRAGSIQLKAGSELCREGEIGRALYLVLEGEIEVVTGGRQLAVIESGELVGEIAVLLKEVPKRTATLRALTDCKLACIPAIEFAEVAKARPSLLVTLAHILAGRIERTDRLCCDLEKALSEDLTCLAESPDSCAEAFRLLEALPDETAFQPLREEAASHRARAERSYKELQGAGRG